MRLLKTLIALATVCVGVSAWAAEPAPAEKPATPAATAPAVKRDEAKLDEKAPAAAEQAKPVDPKEADAKSAEAKPAEAKPADAKPPGDARATPQRFIPSEQVRADFDVSFPIDI
jgi:hypothetical protein